MKRAPAPDGATNCFLVSGRPDEGRPIWLGAEAELHIYCGDSRIDARGIVDALADKDRRVRFAGDPHAWIIALGHRVGADRSTLELALPPIAAHAEAASLISSRLISARNELLSKLEQMPGSWRLAGQSMHWSLECAIPDMAVHALAPTLGPAWILLGEGRGTGGIYLRPRGDRIELCGDFIADPDYAAAYLAFVAGTYQAAMRALEAGEADRIPVCAALQRARAAGERYGLHLGPDAFGPSLARMGRATALPVYRGGSVADLPAQYLLEALYDFAKQDISSLAGMATGPLVEALVHGEAPLAIEREEPDTELQDLPRRDVAHDPSALEIAYGNAATTRKLGGAAVAPDYLDWQAIRYRVSKGLRSVLVSIPRHLLGRFEENLGPSLLEAVLQAEEGALNSVGGELVLARDPREALPPSRPKKKKKPHRCPIACSVEIKKDDDGYAEIKVCLPITRDPTVPPLEPKPPVSPPIGRRNIYLSDGSFFEMTEDMRVRAPGEAFRFARVHRTDNQYDGILGKQWDHLYNKRIVPLAGLPECQEPVFCETFVPGVPGGGQPIDYLPGDGTRERHVLESWAIRKVKFCGAPQFTALVATYAQLPGERFVIMRYAVISGLDPYGADPIFYVLRHYTGTRYIFNCHGYVTHIIDRNANTMRFYYGAPFNPSTGYLVLRKIVDTCGREYTVDYQVHGGIPRIVKLALPLVEPRQVTFHYNGAIQLEQVDGYGGDAMVASQASTLGVPVPHQQYIWRYVYTPESRLADIYSPRAVAAGAGADSLLHIEYDSSGRVWRQRVGGRFPGAPDAGGTITYSYPTAKRRVMKDERQRETSFLLKRVSDRLVVVSSVVKALAIPYRNVTVPGAPSEFRTEYKYNRDFQLIRLVHPGGLIEQHDYQPRNRSITQGDSFESVDDNITLFNDLAKGNLVRSRQISPRPGDLPRGWSWEYDRLFNVVKVKTGPLGNSTHYTYNHGWCARPQDNGNPLEVRSPSRSLPDGTRVPMVESFEYADRGLVARHVDARGIVSTFDYDPDGNQTTELIDLGGANHRIQHRYDATGNATFTTDPRGFTIRRYDRRDRLVELQDRSGSASEFAHDEAGSITREIRWINDLSVPPGESPAPRVARETHRDYDLLGRLVEQIVDPAGLALKTSYRYDVVGNIDEMITPRGNGSEPRARTKYIYDTRDRVVMEIACPDGSGTGTPPEKVQQTIYNAAGHIIAEIGPDRSVVSTVSDGFGFVVLVRDNAGNVVRRVPNALGHPVRVEAYGISSGPTPGDRSGSHNKPLSLLEIDYDEYGSILRRTSYVWDRDAGPSTGVAVDVEEFYRNNSHVPVARVAADGTLTSVLHDGLGRDRVLRDPSGGHIEIEYRHDGAEVATSSVNAPDGDAIRLGQSPIKVTRIDRYDAMSRLIESVGPQGELTAFHYDSDGNLRWMLTPGGGKTEYRYDAAGRRTEEYHGPTYGGFTGGRVHIRHQYDPNDNVIGQIDGLGRATTTVFDSFDRPVSTEDADGRRTAWNYTASGHLFQLTKRDGTVIEHRYDRTGRLERRFETNAGPAFSSQLQRFEYDGAGSMTLAVDDNGNGPDSIVTMGFDSRGRMLSERQGTRTIGFVHDHGGFPHDIDYPSGSTLTYGRDAAGRVKWLGVDGEELVRWSYHSMDLPAEEQREVVLHAPTPADPNRQFSFPLVKQYRYDSARRPRSANEIIQHATNPGSSWLLVRTGTLDYNSDGLVSEVRDPDARRAHRYDGLGRQIYHQASDLSLEPGTVSRTTRTDFDDAGNARTVLTSDKRVLGPDIDRMALQFFNGVNQLRSRMTFAFVGGASAGRVRSERFRYNSQGHLAESDTRVDQLPNPVAGKRSLAYDVFDRLVAAIFHPHAGGPGERLTFEYDALNRRVRTTFWEALPSGGFRYLHHLEHVYAGDRLIEDYASTSQGHAGAPVRRYYWPHRGDMPVAFAANEANIPGQPDLDHDPATTGWVTLYYHTNYAGSLMAISRRDFRTRPGQPLSVSPVAEKFVQGSGGLEIYGIDYSGIQPRLIRRSESESRQRLQSHGQRREREINLQARGARFLDPALGTFVSRDPMSSWADPASLGNAYTYAGNSPANLTDRSGMFAETVFDVASLGFGIYSISQWNEDTPWYDKALDVLGVTVDAVAVALPFVPGGVGVALKSYRAARTVGGALKVLRRFDRVSDAVEVLRFGKSIERGLNLLQGANLAFNAVRSYTRFLETGSWWDAGFALMAAVGARSNLRDAVRGICFPAGTPVLTGEGHRKIEDLLPGDEVLAFKQGELRKVTVIDTAQRTTRKLQRIRLCAADGEEELLETTPEHPFWSRSAGAWVAAADLHEGETVAAASGELRILANDDIALTQPLSVHNLEIADCHTYHAGRLGARVHNQCTWEWVLLHYEHFWQDNNWRGFYRAFLDQRAPHCGAVHEVGTYSQLRRSMVYYGTEANHFPQAAHARVLSAEYDLRLPREAGTDFLKGRAPGKEVAIRLDKDVHDAISAMQRNRLTLPDDAFSLVKQEYNFHIQAGVPQSVMEEALTHYRVLHPADLVLGGGPAADNLDLLITGDTAQLWRYMRFWAGEPFVP